MEAVVVSYRKGRRANHPQQAIVSVKGVKDRDSAKKLVGKRIKAFTKKGKEVIGTVTGAHGNSGRIRARFSKNLPAELLKAEIVE